MRRILWLVLIIAVVVGCANVKKAFVKDIPMEDQIKIHDRYFDRSAWTRRVLEDLGEAGSVKEDTKVRIIDINMAFNGAVTMVRPKDRRRVVYGLEIERPLTPEKIDAALAEIFWFKDPVLRQVDYIRKWGKKTARAIVDREIFIGMSAEAAEEAWGVATKKNVNEIGGKRSEQWVYPAGQFRNKYIYLTDGKVTKWED